MMKATKPKLDGYNRGLMRLNKNVARFILRKEMETRARYDDATMEMIQRLTNVTLKLVGRLGTDIVGDLLEDLVGHVDRGDFGHMKGDRVRVIKKNFKPRVDR